MGVAEKASNSQTQPAEAVNINGISANQEQILALQTQLEKLTFKFDIAVAKTESALVAAQTAMQYNNNVLVSLGVGVAILTVIIAGAGICFQYIFRLSKQEAIEKIENSIANGILPEGSSIRDKLLKTIFNSDEFLNAVESTEFLNAVKSAKEFIDDGGKADEERIENIEELKELIRLKDLEQKNEN